MDVISQGADSADAERARWWRQQKWRAFLALGSTYLIIVLATSFSFLALPSISDDFGVTLRAVGWVVITESLLIAALLLPLGGVADAIGRKRVLTAGMVVFGFGTLFTGLAPTFGLVIGARVVMALGSALIQSVATGMLAAAFPPEERGLAIGAQTTAVAVGSAVAPLVGGIALQVLAWNTLFLLLLVPVVASLLSVRSLIEPDLDGGGRRSAAGGRANARSFDHLGGLLSALTVVVLVLTINNPFALPWLSPGVLAGAAVAAGLLVAFIRRELSIDNPMLQLRLFAIPLFRNAVLVRVLGFIAATTNLLLIPVYLLSARDVSAGLAGLLISALALGMGISAQVSGRLYDRVGPRLPSVLGLVLQVGTAGTLAFATESTPLPVVAVVAFLAGVAMALWNVPNNSAMLAATPAASLGVGGAFTNVTRTVGSVIGQALATAVVAGVMAAKGFDIPLGELSDTAGAELAFISGWRVAYLIAAGLSAITLMAALRLPTGHVGVDRSVRATGRTGS